MSEVKKVITVADRSTKALTASAAALLKVATDLNTLAENSAKLSQEIEYKQSDLDDLNSQFDTRFREASAELKLKVVEDEDKVLASLLKSRGLVTIAPAELSAIRSELEHAQRDLTEELAAAKSEGERSASVSFQAQKAALVSDHKVAIAQYEANAKASDLRIEFLEGQNADLKEQIAAERETRLEIARAEAQRQGVVVNNGK